MNVILLSVSILCGVVWLLSILRTLSYRHLASMVQRSRSMSPAEGEMPGFSVIITAHDQCHELRKHLPLILDQIYDRFEVIVVDIASTDGTKDLLEGLEQQYTNLRHTFVPASNRDVSTDRLAITLGVKAAYYPWFVLTKADCQPMSHLWLRRLGEAVAGHRAAKMVVGYTRYAEARNYTTRRMRFFRMWQSMLTLSFINKGGLYRHDGTNLAYSKDLFLGHQGFASHSTLRSGAVDIMVNQNSTRHNTALCLHPEAILTQSEPRQTDRWRLERRVFQETRKHFRHKWLYRLRYAFLLSLHALLVLSMTACIALSVWQQQYVVAGSALLLWVVHFILQGKMVNHSARTLEGASVGLLRVAWFVHCIPFWNLHAFLAYCFSDKKQFRKKYI